MKRTFQPVSRQSQKGAVAVEAAVCIAFVLIPLLSFVLLFGRFYWYYTAAQKAIHDATLYMASAPLSEIKSRGAEKLANFILAQETADFDSATTTEPTVECGYKSGNSIRFRDCSATLTPLAVQSTIVLTVPHPFLIPASFGLGTDLSFFIVAEMPYVGR